MQSEQSSSILSSISLVTTMWLGRPWMQNRSCRTHFVMVRKRVELIEIWHPPQKAAHNHGEPWRSQTLLHWQQQFSLPVSPRHQMNLVECISPCCLHPSRKVWQSLQGYHVIPWLNSLQRPTSCSPSILATLEVIIWPSPNQSTLQVRQCAKSNPRQSGILFPQWQQAQVKRLQTARHQACQAFKCNSEDCCNWVQNGNNAQPKDGHVLKREGKTARETEWGRNRTCKLQVQGIQMPSRIIKRGCLHFFCRCK